MWCRAPDILWGYLETDPSSRQHVGSWGIRVQPNTLEPRSDRLYTTTQEIRSIKGSCIHGIFISRLASAIAAASSDSFLAMARAMARSMAAGIAAFLVLVMASFTGEIEARLRVFFVVLQV